MREYYRRNYPLTAAPRAQWNLNPGNGRVVGLCCEPRVCLAELEEMFAPHISGGRIAVLTGYKPVAADTDGDRVRAVTVRGSATGQQVVLRAPWFKPRQVRDTPQFLAAFQAGLRDEGIATAWPRTGPSF